MATFQSFGEIEAWQKARALTQRVYVATNEGTFSRDFGLRDQIRRASVSIMSDTAEGCERSGTGEFLQFLAIAKGSAGEVRAQLYVAFDQGYLQQDVFEELLGTAAQISRMLSGLMIYLRKSNLAGTKYKKS